MKTTALTYAIFLGSIFGIYTTGCGFKDEKDVIVAQDIEKGRHLAQRYCVNCHRFPGPELLDKTTWQNGIMPVMAKKLGIDDFHGMLTANSGSSLSVEDFKLISDFYYALAPEKLIEKPLSDKPLNDMAFFNVKTVLPTNVLAPPLTTALAYNRFDGLLYSADAANNLFSWNKKLSARFIKKMPSPVTCIVFSKTDGKVQMVVSCIGSMMPANVNSGKVLQYDLSNKKLTNEVVLADKLPRPVKVVPGDFNRDGHTDYVVLCFGHENGGLYWLRQLPSHRFKKELIRGVSGAIDATVTDIDGDGWADIVCLFAQANEGIWAFLNDHRGGFTAKNLLHFPPVYGSNSFQLVDE